MLIEQGDICIINPKDEEPHNEVSTKRMIHFQHGDTKVSNDDMSIAFVFRVSPHECVCNCDDNKVILPEDVLKSITEKEMYGIVNHEKRMKKYKSMDVAKYHNVLKSHFASNYKF